MADAFLGEIRMAGFGFAPKGWAACDGQLLPLNQNTALFSLLGTSFGGNGTTTFGLPNLQGASPLGFGAGPGLSARSLGETGGVATVSLQTTEVPGHTHTAAASTAVGGQDSPAGGVWAVPGGVRGETAYATAGVGLPMAPGAIGLTGQGQAHDNRPPYTTVNFIICQSGFFPPRS